MEDAYFAEQIITWYENHRRDLPWRTTKDPYLIWLSEVILQQTRVAQGLPYYHKFAEAFPSVDALAAASQQEVLRLWQGLGYYSRARNLHACAKTIVSEYGGLFPARFAELIKLRGVGMYTAAAIASFAFNETVPVLDGNVFRVLSRVFGVKEDIASGKGQQTFRKLAVQLVPEGKAAVYNQAIMEFGALQCTPTTPACLLCPLHTLCYAFQHGQQHLLPVKLKKPKVKKRFLHYIVVRQGSSLLMKQRTEKDIWSGLYDFYLIEAKSEQSLGDLEENALISHLLSEKNVSIEISEPYKHQLTHQQLFIRFFVVDVHQPGLLKILAEKYHLEVFSIEETDRLPKPILIDKFLHRMIF